MKRVTKSNLIKLVEMKKKYLETKDKELLQEINEFIDNVIKKDKGYYKKLKNYEFDNEILGYLM